MSKKAIPEKYMDLFQKNAFGHLATLMPDGSPQVTPVWLDYKDGHILVNSARGRQKDRNMRHDPRVAISILDPEDPYRYLQVRGRVVEMTEIDAGAHIDKLAFKYLGREKFESNRDGDIRVIYKIAPE